MIHLPIYRFGFLFTPVSYPLLVVLNESPLRSRLIQKQPRIKEHEFPPTLNVHQRAKTASLLLPIPSPEIKDRNFGERVVKYVYRHGEKLFTQLT
jgi:hypothetical protein